MSAGGVLVEDLSPYLDDIPIKGTRESIDSPELIAVPVPGPYHWRRLHSHVGMDQDLGFEAPLIVGTFYDNTVWSTC